MPDMKSTLRPADDETLLKKLESAAIKIRNSETDRDVQDAIQEAIQDMKNIGVVFNKEQDQKNVRTNMDSA
jgi:predicted transcriptional regulator